MPDSIAEWLEKLDLSHFTEVLAEQQIDFDILPDLDEEDFEKLGIPLGPRKKLLKAIARLVDTGIRPPGKDVPADAYATRMATWERHPDERKPATVLFADVTGSTAITEQLDPEDAHDILDGARRRICSSIENHRGTICRVTGDGVMAVFGAPIASEQHALDACAAACEMQQTMREFTEDVRVRFNRDIKIRVGLHSGEIVVLTGGDGEKTEYDADGPTVPIAARMEQSAKPGEIYLTAATAALAKPRIETDALTPISAKGVSEPVAAFSLRRVLTAEEPALESNRSPFVGRRAELVQFRGLLETCIEEGHGQTILVRGEPGIGKTRLVEEYMSIGCEAGVSCYRSLVLPFAVGKGQDAVGSLVRSFLGIRQGSQRAVRRTVLEASVSDGRVSSDEVVFLNDLLDLAQPSELDAVYDAMDNATRLQGRQRVACKLLQNVAEAGPALVIVEDVHWADPITLDYLAAFAKTAANCPSVLVMTSRIEGDQLDRKWLTRTERSPFVMIELTPLRREDAMKLMGQFIDTDGPLAASCLDRAAGNPLFLEQLLRSAQEGSSDTLPDSIQSLVLAQLDRLAAIDKRALQAASVIGQRFELELLRRLIEVDDYDCKELIEQRLIRPEDTGYYLFAHALIQESVYSSLLKRQRRSLHLRAADWFEEVDAALYAEHLDSSEDGRAAHAYLAAAKERQSQHRLEGALDLARRGIVLASAEDGVLLWSLSGELNRNLGLISESVEDYRRAHELATQPRQQCHALIGSVESLRIAEKYPEMLEALVEAETVAKAHDMFPELAQISQLRGGVHFMRGDIVNCRDAGFVAMEYARSAKSPELEARSLSNLGDAEYAAGRMRSAQRYFDNCVDLGLSNGLSHVVAPNLAMRGYMRFYNNELQIAIQDHRQAIELAMEIRQPRTSMFALQNGATCLAEAGLVREGKAWAQESLEIAQQLGAPLFEANALVDMARVLNAERNRKEARPLVSKAVSIIRASKAGGRYSGPWALGLLALVTDDPTLRRSAIAEGEQLLNSGCIASSHLWFYRDAMELFLETEQWDAVEQHAQSLAEYTEAEPLPWSNFYIDRGRILARLGRGDVDSSTLREANVLLDTAKCIGLRVAIPAIEAALKNS